MARSAILKYLGFSVYKDKDDKENVMDTKDDNSFVSFSDEMCS